MDEETRKAIEYAERVMKNPEKYGFTSEQVHQWAVDKHDSISGIIERIPESLRDGLADAAISAYKEKMEQVQRDQDEKPCNIASPTRQEPPDKSDP